MALDVPAKNVSNADVDQVERLFQHFGLSALSASLHTHDDVLVHV
jgi:hypothetical protein